MHAKDSSWQASIGGKMVTFIQFSCALTVVTVSTLNPEISRMVGILGMIFFSLILIGKNKQIFPLTSAGAAHIFPQKHLRPFQKWCFC
jgi:hypothetical protein